MRSYAKCSADRKHVPRAAVSMQMSASRTPADLSAIAPMSKRFHSCHQGHEKAFRWTFDSDSLPLRVAHMDMHFSLSRFAPIREPTMSQSAISTERILTKMAYNREAFKNRVEEKVGGALLEYYKAVLATLNGQTRWVKHWHAEVDRLLDSELVVVLLHTIKGFKDRNKAALEVLLQLRASDDRYQRSAEHIVKKDFDLKRITTKIPDELSASFYARVEDLVALHT